MGVAARINWVLVQVISYFLIFLRSLKLKLVSTLSFSSGEYMVGPTYHSIIGLTKQLITEM